MLPRGFGPSPSSSGSDILTYLRSVWVPHHPILIGKHPYRGGAWLKFVFSILPNPANAQNRRTPSSNTALSLFQCPTSGGHPRLQPSTYRHRHRSATPTRHSLPTPVPTNRSFVLGHGTTYNTLLLYRLHHRGTPNGPIGLRESNENQKRHPAEGTEKSSNDVFYVSPC